jgi:hypothetical protein
MQIKYKKLFFSLLLGSWVTGVVSGIVILGQYEFSPGDAGENISRRPAALSIPFAEGKIAERLGARTSFDVFLFD